MSTGASCSEPGVEAPELSPLSLPPTFTKIDNIILITSHKRIFYEITKKLSPESRSSDGIGVNNVDAKAVKTSAVITTGAKSGKL